MKKKPGTQSHSQGAAVKLPAIFLVLFLLLPGIGFSQFSAGPNDTINPGVPVTLTANYGLLANGVVSLDNRVEGPFDIGFTFTFYGNKYTRFSIG